MTEALAGQRSERVDSRQGYRSGFYSRSLITRVGTIELRVPRKRCPSTTGLVTLGPEAKQANRGLGIGLRPVLACLGDRHAGYQIAL